MRLPATTTVRRHRTEGGLEIYSISITLFENFRGNVYVVDHPDALILIDCGSGLNRSNRGIEQGLTEIAQRFGRHFELRSFDVILITHGHIDHFGGLVFLLEESDAAVWVHPTDSEILSNFPRRVRTAVRSVKRFLGQSGIPPEERETLLEIYHWGKDHYQSQEVNPCLIEGQLDPFGFQIFHAPGHCPGQVCIQADDVLFTGDHVLARISPHLAPRSITPKTGLATYFSSLLKIRKVPGVRVSLAGHEAPIPDLAARCLEIEELHRTRLIQVEQLCRQPVSIHEVSRQLFGELHSYHILLGLEEAGALMEFLVEQGRLQTETSADGTVYHSCF